MLNLGHWRLLVATADTGNISRAAERVGITQSGASQAIAQLEASLGLQVFTRSRKEVAVTALGEQVIDHARRDAVSPKFSSLAFKLMTDPFVGQLTFVRVYSGVLKSGDTVFNPIK
ncbi:hypothetical protein DAI43_32100, partial [Achromobacter xylosoxidans]